MHCIRVLFSLYDLRKSSAASLAQMLHDPQADKRLSVIRCR